MAKAKGKSKKNGGAVGDFVVRSRVKEQIAKAKCQSSGDIVDALNGVIAWYLEQGIKRAKSNGRKTVRCYDICCE